MVRKLIACLLLGPIALVVAAGCSDRKGAAEIPTKEIPLPPGDPSPAGVGGKKVQQVNPPKGSSSAQ
jgi:hypothetical protein